MTKREYLRQLEVAIELLDEDIADDIIEHYRTRFDEGKKYESKTALEVIDELGTPKELAKRIYSSYGIREDLWTSARQEDVKTRKVIPVILFDILIASWLIPLLVFITLAGFGSFVTFPFVISAVPGLTITDGLLVTLLAIGTYAILLLLMMGLTEVGIVIVKNILIWNLKVLSPKNKTTARLIKGFSLFQWMREMKLGRNLFINIGMIGISVISISFILLSNFSPDVFSVFASNATLNDNNVRDMSAEIESGEAYTISINVGDVDVRIVENPGENLEVNHQYNLEDGFNLAVDLDENTINISTLQDEVNDTFFRDYSAEMFISIPEGLNIDVVYVTTLEGNVDILDFEAGNIRVANQIGDIYLYSMESDDTTIISEEGSITLIEGYYQKIDIATTTSFITVNNINNMLKDGDTLEITTFGGTVDLKNTYYKNIDVSTNSAPIYLVNENTIYEIETLNITSPEGEIIIDASYIE